MNNQYTNNYTDAGFWAKVKNNVKKAGKDLIIKALTLYFSLQDNDTPAWARAVIVGALGYLIMPLDLIPDFKPVIGYADDAMVIAMAMAQVAVHIKDSHVQQAHDVWSRWAKAPGVAA